MITVDTVTIINNVIPPRLRSDEFISFISSLLSHNETMLQEFYNYYNSIRYDMAFNGQVMNLEHLLNDKFDNINRLIYITDPVVAAFVYLFNNSEAQPPTWLFNNSEAQPPVYLSNFSEYNTGFVIYVPLGIVGNWDEFRYYVEKYKLKSKIYQIIEY